MQVIEHSLQASISHTASGLENAARNAGTE